MVLGVALGAALGGAASAVFPLVGKRVAEASIGKQRVQAIQQNKVRPGIQAGRYAAYQVEQSKIRSASKRLGPVGGFIAEYGASVPGVKAAPEVLKQASAFAAIARLDPAALRRLAAAGGDVKKYLEQSPEIIPDQAKAAFLEATETNLRSQGYTVQQAKQLAQDAYYVEVTAPEIGRAGATFGLEFSSEVGGRALTAAGIQRELLKQGGKAVTTKEGVKIVTRAALPSLATFGFIEGAGESVASQLSGGDAFDPTTGEYIPRSDIQKVDPIKAIGSGVFGAFTAAALGTFIARRAVSSQGAAKGLERLAEFLDPGEVFGDVAADKLRIGGANIPIRVITITPSVSPAITSVAPAPVGSETTVPIVQKAPTPSQVKISVITESPTPVPVETQTPSPITQPTPEPTTTPEPTPTPETTTTPEPTPTPEPEPTPDTTVTPAPTPTQTETIINVPVPTVTPVRGGLPPILPAPFVPGEGGGGRSGRDTSRFYSEIRAARRLARQLL